MPQALVPGRGGQPAADPVRVLDPVDVLEQSQPGRLGYVSGVAVGQLEFPGHRPDQPLELFDQSFPGPAVTGRCTADELGDIWSGSTAGPGGTRQALP